MVDKEFLTKMIDLSLQSYKEKPVLKNLELLKNDRTNDYGIEYLFSKDENGNYYLSFAGTNEIKDVLVDIDFWQKTIPYDNTQTKIRVHKGFYKSYLSVRIRILSYLIENKVKSLYVTGHSYGAALAILAAVDIQYNLPNIEIKKVVTFGSPRVGNKEFISSFNKRVPQTFRVENGNDLITRLPPFFMGYGHIGNTVHIGKDKKWYLLSICDHFAKQYKIKIEEGVI